MTLLDQCQDEFWGLVHEPITSPKRMLLVIGTISLRLAQDGHVEASTWLLDQCQGEAPLNRRKATQDRRGVGPAGTRYLSHPLRRTSIRRSTDPAD